MSQSSSSPGLRGTQDIHHGTTPFNAMEFIARAVASGMATVTLVKVMAVTNDGGVSAVGFVDILPLVHQVDGDGNIVPHGVISRCPYQRAQGGGNAVILDPEVNDIGIAVFASRDISSVIATKAAAQPGSRRQHDWADGLYIGGVLNGVPTQWVRFSASGIELHSPTQIHLESPAILLDSETLVINASTSTTINTPTFTVNGNVVNNGDVHTTGDTQLDGGATVAGATTLQTTLQVDGAAGFAAALIDQRTGKDIGGAHTHGHGTIASSGVSDPVT